MTSTTDTILGMVPTMVAVRVASRAMGGTRRVRRTARVRRPRKVRTIRKVVRKARRSTVRRR